MRGVESEVATAERKPSAQQQQQRSNTSSSSSSMFLQLVAQLFVQFTQEAFVADERSTGDNPTAKYANVNYAFQNEAWSWALKEFVGSLDAWRQIMLIAWMMESNAAATTCVQAIRVLDRLEPDRVPISLSLSLS